MRNFAAISGTEDVGGIAGYVENGTILGTGSAIYNYANTYNTGKVTGTTNTGGIVGHARQSTCTACSIRMKMPRCPRRAS